jgi:prevent-host-death family protein
MFRAEAFSGTTIPGKLVKLSMRAGAMRIIDIREAKTHLSRLVEQAAKGEPFVIAKDGKPMVRVTALDTPAPKKARRLDFMSGQFTVPDDFDRMGASEIEELFARLDPLPPRS